jgi:hypothetical protein
VRISAAHARLDGWMHGCLSLFPAWACCGSVERITPHLTWFCFRGMAADEADGASLSTSQGLQRPEFAAGVARPDTSSSSMGPT